MLAALIGLDPSAGYEPDESDARQLRERITQTTIDLLGSFVSSSGTVLLAEDVHWFDDESRDLLATLIRDQSPSVLILLTSRNRADAPRGDRSVVLEPRPLDQPGRLTMLRHVAGGALEPDVLLDLARRSDGVPLYLEELGRSALHPATDAPMPGNPGGSEVPDMLYEALVARLQVDVNGIALAAAAATIGREADHDLLVRVGGLGVDALEAALDALVQALVLEPLDDESRRYRFRHELLRAVAYDLQPPSRQRDLHGRVADALVDAPDADTVDWAIVATHYELAGRPMDAVNAYDDASAVARRRGALIEARALLGRAIEVAAQAQADAEREVDLRLRRGFLSVSLEGNTSAQAAEDYERCLELAVDAGPNEALLATLNALWTYYCAKGELDRAGELLELISQHVGPEGAAARFLTTVGKTVVAMYRGDNRTALQLGEQALASEGAFDLAAARSEWWFMPLDPVGSCHTYLGMTKLLQGDAAGALEHQRASLRAVADLPFPTGAFSRAGYDALAVWVLCELGELSGAAALLDEVEEARRPARLRPVDHRRHVAARAARRPRSARARCRRRSRHPVPPRRSARRRTDDVEDGRAVGLRHLLHDHPGRVPRSRRRGRCGARRLRGGARHLLVVGHGLLRRGDPAPPRPPPRGPCRARPRSAGRARPGPRTGDGRLRDARGPRPDGAHRRYRTAARRAQRGSRPTRPIPSSKRPGHFWPQTRPSSLTASRSSTSSASTRRCARG